MKGRNNVRLKKTFALCKLRQAFWRALEAQVLATSDIIMRSNCRSSFFSTESAFNSRPRCVLVVRNSQIKGEEVAQGRY